MSMIEAPEPPRRPRRKYKRRKLPAAIARPANELTGITVKLCPPACSAERCVISGIGVCSHPHKGSPYIKTQEAIARFNAAKKMLGKRKVDV